MSGLLIISIICFILDFTSKIFITTSFELNESVNIIDNFFSITYIRNTGAAFGILSGNTPLLILITFLILFLFIYYARTKTFSKIEEISYGLIIGGALGNLFDRIINNYVIDFFSFNIFGYEAPIFNIADIFVVIGVFLLIIDSFGGLKWKRK